MNWDSNITNFFNNIKTIITSFFDFFPQELKGVLVPVLIIICGLFIYRFIR